MDDIVIEKTELVIKALEYAHEHNLDVNNKTDVKKILEQLDPQHISNDEVKEFMRLLQNADMFMEVTAFKKERKKTELPN